MSLRESVAASVRDAERERGELEGWYSAITYRFRALGAFAEAGRRVLASLDAEAPPLTVSVDVVSLPVESPPLPQPPLTPDEAREYVAAGVDLPAGCEIPPPLPGESEDAKGRMSRHLLRQAGSRYRDRECIVCHRVFTPTGPRSDRCPRPECHR